MKCTLETDEPYNTIERLFRTELTRTHPRSTITLTEDGDNAVFRIEADDTAAMRAALNGITSILSIHEKTHGRNAEDPGA